VNNHHVRLRTPTRVGTSLGLVPKRSTKHRFTSTGVESTCDSIDYQADHRRNQYVLWCATAPLLTTKPTRSHTRGQQEGQLFEQPALQRTTEAPVVTPCLSYRASAGASTSHYLGGLSMETELAAYMECATRDYLESHRDALSPFLRPSPSSYCRCCPALRRCPAGTEHFTFVLVNRERGSS
jgi:hypothetical protein